MAKLYKYGYSPIVYEVVKGVTKPITSMAEFKKKGYKWSQVQAKKGTLIKYPGSAAVYEYHPETGQKFAIPSAEVLKRAGYSFGDVNADPTAAYRILIEDWYKQKPSTPSPFEYSAEEEEAAKRSVGEEYKPYYQEQVSQSAEEFRRALANAREGFSRRGLWGAAAPVETTIDPETGLATTNVGTTVDTRGPVSGLRQAGIEEARQAQGRSTTAFQRAYKQSVAGGVQERRGEAEDVWQKTIKDPYEQAYQDWLARLEVLQSKNQ